MAPELFAVSYAGAPKIVVTDFVDEVRISASRGVEFVGEGRGASSPSDEVGGVFFLDSGPIRRSPRPSTGSRRHAPTTSARRSVAVSLAWRERRTARPR